MRGRNAKQIAMDIVNGDDQAKCDLEEMFGCKLQEMTTPEKILGLALLSAKEVWSN